MKNLAKSTMSANPQRRLAQDNVLQMPRSQNVDVKSEFSCIIQKLNEQRNKIDQTIQHSKQVSARVYKKAQQDLDKVSVFASMYDT